MRTQHTTSAFPISSAATGKDLARVFRNERLAELDNFGEAWGYLPSSVANVFVDNHDTQRDTPGTLTYKDNGLYALAWGYITINDEDFAITGRSYHSNLPAGRYCDIIRGIGESHGEMHRTAYGCG